MIKLGVLQCINRDIARGVREGGGGERGAEGVGVCLSLFVEKHDSRDQMDFAGDLSAEVLNLIPGGSAELCPFHLSESEPNQCEVRLICSQLCLVCDAILAGFGLI